MNITEYNLRHTITADVCVSVEVSHLFRVPRLCLALPAISQILLMVLPGTRTKNKVAVTWKAVGGVRQNSDISREHKDSAEYFLCVLSSSEGSDINFVWEFFHPISNSFQPASWSTTHHNGSLLITWKSLQGIKQVWVNLGICNLNQMRNDAVLQLWLNLVSFRDEIPVSSNGELGREEMNATAGPHPTGVLSVGDSLSTCWLIKLPCWGLGW